MNATNTITATTARPLEFTRHAGQSKRTETYPAGTEVTLDALDMEANPKFFNIQIAGTTSNVQTYAGYADITPAA